MAKKSLQEALDTIEMSYSELNEIANNMTEPFFQSINELTSQLGDINSLSNDQVRNFMINMAMKSYSLSEVKEKAALKSSLAEAVRKETYSRKFSEGEGTQGIKDNYAMLECSNEVVAQALYESVAALFKSKADNCNRLVDTCKTVIMSRMSEAKLTTNSID